MLQDWELKHKELCKENPEERKVKGNLKERVASEKKTVETSIQMMKDLATGGFKNVASGVIKVCKKEGRRKKAARAAKAASSRATNGQGSKSGRCEEQPEGGCGGNGSVGGETKAGDEAGL